MEMIHHSQFYQTFFFFFFFFSFVAAAREHVTHPFVKPCHSHTRQEAAEHEEYTFIASYNALYIPVVTPNISNGAVPLSFADFCFSTQFVSFESGTSIRRLCSPSKFGLTFSQLRVCEILFLFALQQGNVWLVLGSHIDMYYSIGECISVYLLYFFSVFSQVSSYSGNSDHSIFKLES